jgi:hypothetical protein
MMRVYVTPHMVTNSFREWGLPIWIFLSPGLFQHGDSPYGYGDWCFCLPLSHQCAGAPSKILAKKPKFYRMVTGIHKSPYWNRDSLFPYGD